MLPYQLIEKQQLHQNRETKDQGSKRDIDAVIFPNYQNGQSWIRTRGRKGRLDSISSFRPYEQEDHCQRRRMVKQTVLLDV